MSLWTLNVQFNNGFNDLVSAFVHRIWGDYNSTISRSLIGSERVLHDYWARILDSRRKKLLWCLYGNEALLHFTATYMTVMSHEMSGNCEVIWLCVPQRRQRRRSHKGGIGVVLGHWLGWERELCGPDAQRCNILQSKLKTWFFFLITPTMSAFLPSHSKYLPLLL